MPVATAQPIAGVSANRETEIEVIYPSVAAGGLGKAVGLLMECAAVPFTPARLVLSVLLGIPGALLGLPAYILSKLFGNCYVLTNRSIKVRTILSNRVTDQVALGEIDHIEIRTQAGYKFHRVGDLLLEGAQGNTLMVIPAIPFPQRLKQVILDARAARLRSDEALSRIQSRKS